MVVRHLRLKAPADIQPHINGLWPRDPLSKTSIVQHIIDYPRNTPYISATTRFPKGVPGWNKEKVYIDLDAAQKAGVKVYTTEQVATELNLYKKAYPHTAQRIDAALKNLYKVENEVLLEPEQGKSIPSSAIWKPEIYQFAQRAQVLYVISLVFTAYNLGAATNQSIKEESIRPIAKETIKQAAGWGTAWMGFKIGFASGALFTSETGPLALGGGLIGGFICGVYGYHSGELLGNWLFD